MATLAEPLLMTVAQYRELPHREDVIEELHCGRLVALTRPKMKHVRLQQRLVAVLTPLATDKGIIAAEVPFRALPEYELRGADVAFVSHLRWAAADDKDNLQGSPELVIEVLSASNTKAEMREKATLCLTNGAEEFWIVHPKRKTVTVMRRSGASTVYEERDVIPIPLFETSMRVASIFE